MKNKPHCRDLGIIVSNDLIPSIMQDNGQDT